MQVTEAEEQRYAELQAMALDCARQGETPLLASMLQAGLPVNLTDPKGNTLLMLAAYHGHPGTVQALIQHGAEVDRRNCRGQTPLGGVAFKGHAEVARLLLEAGADPSADTGNGATPLMFASLFGRAAIVDLLKPRLRAPLRWHLAKTGAWISSRLQRLCPGKAPAC